MTRSLWPPCQPGAGDTLNPPGPADSRDDRPGADPGQERTGRKAAAAE
jgi:hypothetical protein